MTTSESASRILSNTSHTLNPAQQAQETARLVIPLWLVWIAALIFVGAGLGSYAILDNNEGLYAEISREMLRSGDWRQWVIPHLNGLAYMEKPPLLYWLTAISFAIFGESEWAARLVPALSGLGCVAMILWFGQKIARPQTARLAALLFTSSLGVIMMSRTLMFDMLLTALLSTALLWAYLFVYENNKTAQRWSMLFLALALMAKGFVAVILFCAIAGSFTMASSTSVADLFRRLGAWFDWKAIGIFLLISLPWHVIASVAEPIFAWFYFINEHVLRFLGKREPHDYYAGAWWYYLPRTLIFLFPWSFFLPVLLFARSDKKTDRRLLLFLTLAWLMPFLFFSISSAKANYYLVAVMPFAALQLAILLEDRQFGRTWGRLAPGLLLAMLLAVLAWWVARQTHGMLEALNILGQTGSRFLSGSFAGMAILSLLAGIVSWRRSRSGILAYLLPALGALFVLLSVLQASTALTSARPIADILQREHAGRDVFMFRTFEERSALPFYLKKPVYIIESRSNDLFWGNKLHRNNIVVSGIDFLDYAQSRPAVVIVLNQDIPLFMTKSYYKYFREEQKIGNAHLFLN
ncbi:glycosyltransferase family 39 protein [Undibacterium sp.]|uniref:ArnT family glycosyltransferase n=1 Tax=Undibacterium sp. TaxID=1914977 RepID=UPI002CB9B255|nr:glycosyltransferase family 39 protein [Undibacterium sp.]HTD05389.1 glycosyltransferase family 39 protein [Undibacterium sp.]